MVDFVEKLVKDATEITDTIRVIAGATQGIDLNVVAQALGQYQNAVYAELYRREDEKYTAKETAEAVFGMDGNAGVPN